MKHEAVNPHAIEGHSQAHAEAFDSLMERIGKACQQQKPAQQQERPQPGFGSQTHRAYPEFRFGR